MKWATRERISWNERHLNFHGEIPWLKAKQDFTRRVKVGENPRYFSLVSILLNIGLWHPRLVNLILSSVFSIFLCLVLSVCLSCLSLSSLYLSERGWERERDGGKKERERDGRKKQREMEGRRQERERKREFKTNKIPFPYILTILLIKSSSKFISRYRKITRGRDNRTK